MVIVQNVEYLRERVAQLRRRGEEIAVHERNVQLFGAVMGSLEAEEARRLPATLAAAEQELRQAEAAAEHENGLAAALRGLIGQRHLTEIHRQFIVRQVEHLAALCLEHRLRVCYDGITPRAGTESRAIYVDRTLTDEAIAQALHEIGHVADPRADGHQQRHTYEPVAGVSYVNAPVAEAYAWRWAAANVWEGYWTERMQQEATRCLLTYRDHARANERDFMAATVRELSERVRPAPDTPEGRAAIAAMIRCERRAAEIAAERSTTPRLDRALARVKEL